MKVKKLTKTARKALCAILTAAMVFADSGIAVYAEERAQAQESMTVEESVEAQENVMTEEDVETQESVTAEETADAGHSDDSLEKEEETEQTVTEEALTEGETEASSEEELKLDASDGNIAGGNLYDDNGKVRLVWKVDVDGNFSAEGELKNGELFSIFQRKDDNDEEIKKKIKTITIDATGDIGYVGPWDASWDNLESVNISSPQKWALTAEGISFNNCSNLTSIELSNLNI